MVDLTTQTKFLTLKSLIISFLIHLVIFNLFTLSFSPFLETPKPQFIFLGQILKRALFISPSLREGEEDHRADQKELPFEFTKDPQLPSVLANEKKPIMTNTGITPPKKSIKSTFGTSPLEEKDSSSNPKNLGLESEIQPYKPFKFKSR